MFDISTIIFIKENLLFLHYVVGIGSFLIGISPLFLDREKVQKQANVFYIEISAAIFMIFTISMLSLDYLSAKPLFDEENCISMKQRFIKDIPFNELIKYEQGSLKIKEKESNYYLIFNSTTRTHHLLDITKDYRYQKVNCK